MLIQIVLALVFIVGLFFLLGFIVTEQRNINEVQVKAPIELCWEIYQDESRIGEWMEGVSNIQLIDGTAGRVGAKQKVIMAGAQSSSVSASSSELERTITKISAPSTFRYDYTNEMMNGKSEISFLAADSITHIKSMDVFSGKQLWLRSSLFLMKSSINKKTQAQFEKLKLIIEQEYKAQLKQEAERESESSASEIIEKGIEID